MPEERDAPVTKADLQALATKADLHAVRAELKGDIQAVRSDMQAMEERLNERIHDSQTALLRAFHGWARSMEIRSRGTTTTVVGFDERLVLVEERVSELERRNIG
jgi:hypothetical protein